MTSSARIAALTRERDRLRELADPATRAAVAAASAAADARFRAPMEALYNEGQALLAGRNPYSLAGSEALRFMSLNAEYAALLAKYSDFMAAYAAVQLKPGNGSEPGCS